MGTLVSSHSSELGEWEMTVRPPHRLLLPYIRRYCGYVENTSFSSRIEVASGDVVAIIGFGAPTRLIDLRCPDHSSTRQSFFAGLFDSPVIAESCGATGGLQIDFTPIGAYRFFGAPMHELANRVVGLADLLGPFAARLSEELQSLPAWEPRFELVERMIAERVGAAPESSAAVVLAYDRICASGGRAAIGAIAGELGWSQKHLIHRFREQIGLPPKTLSRIVRFGRATELMRDPNAGPWADIAYRCGYFDQAHLIRDFHEFAGATPSAFAARTLPDNGGIRGDGL